MLVWGGWICASGFFFARDGLVRLTEDGECIGLHRGGRVVRVHLFHVPQNLLVKELKVQIIQVSVRRRFRAGPTAGSKRWNGDLHG